MHTHTHTPAHTHHDLMRETVSITHHSSLAVSQNCFIFSPGPTHAVLSSWRSGSGSSSGCGSGDGDGDALSHCCACVPLHRRGRVPAGAKSSPREKCPPQPFSVNANVAASRNPSRVERKGAGKDGAGGGSGEGSATT